MARGPEDAAALASGRAWDDFCDALKEAGHDLLRPSAPKGPMDLAEGHRYLTHALRSSLELIMEGGDGLWPLLTVSLGGSAKLGWDNPDNLHLNASLRGDCSYRLTGTRGDALYASLGVYAGSYARGGSRTIAFVEFDDLERDEGGRFEVVLSPSEHPGNWIRLDPDTTSMMIRQTFWDRARERAANLTLERIDGDATPAALTPEFVASALRRSVRMIRGTNRIIFDWADRFAERPNTFLAGDEEANRNLQGVPGNDLAGGWWRAAPDEAIVIDFEPPACRYWSFVLSNYWGQSFDPGLNPVAINTRTARARADGSVRIVVAHANPGLADANWLDTAGHGEGVWQFRWLDADHNVVPTPRVVPWSSLARP